MTDIDWAQPLEGDGGLIADDLVDIHGQDAKLFHATQMVLPRRTDDNLLINWGRNCNNEQRSDRVRIVEMAEYLRSHLRA